MTGYLIAGAWLLLVAAVLCAFHAASLLHRREDADYDAHRTPGMGEPGSPAELDDDAAVAAWLGGGA